MVGNNKGPRRLDSLGSQKVSRPRSAVRNSGPPSTGVRPKEPSAPSAITSKSRRPLRSWRRVAGVLFAIVLIAGCGVGLKIMMVGQKAITRNVTAGAPALTGKIDPTKLRGEGDGRINILLLGIGGAGHEGGTLSDTIMVASIDPDAKTVAMLSIPRDLYVQIPGYGYGKINTATAHGETTGRGAGAELAKQTLSRVLDIPVHYYARVDFAGFKQAVDAVGGVDITVPIALSDPSYPCDKNPGRACGFTLGVGLQHMDGVLALKYSRCRKGNCGNDYGRAARQQQILVALQQKSLAASTLTNPIKLLGLVDAAGSHVTTDLQPAEIQKLSKLISEIDQAAVVSKVLDTSTEGLLANGNISGAGSIQIPRLGLGRYDEIRALVHTLFADRYIKTEAANVQVQNATGREGVATAVANVLKTYNYNVVDIVTASTADYPKTVLYDYSNGAKPYTLKYLEQRFGVVAQKISQPTPSEGVGSSPQPDISLILGADYQSGARTSP